MRRLLVWLMLLLILAITGSALAEDLLWEDGDTMARNWHYTDGSVKGTVDVSTAFVKQGSGALCFTIQPPIPADSWAQFRTLSTFPADWSRFNQLTFELYNGHTGNIWVSVHVYQGAQKTTLVAYAKEAPGWSSIALPLPRGLANVTAMVLVFNSNESRGHSIYIDNMQLQEESRPVIQRADIRLFKVENGSFESYLHGWQTSGATNAAPAAYFGQARARLSKGGSVAQALYVGDAGDAPHVGDQVEAGVWALVPAAADLSSGGLHVLVEAIDSRNNRTLLSQVDTQQPPVTGTWFFLKTKSLAKVPAGTARIAVDVRSDLSEVYLDYIQVCTKNDVKGVPERAVLGHLMPWYSTAENGWSHWRYGEHDPTRQLADGRLDAASVYYPYIGLYDSLDPDVIEYQTDLALAMGLDIIDIDWYGFQLHPWQVSVVDGLLAAAERKGLKVSLRYEPKVHVSNWIPHAAKTEALEAVAQDLIGLVQRWGHRPGYLHIDGLPVVGTFGMLTLSSAEWQWIYDRVTAAAGDVHLMGDQAPNDQSDPQNWYPMFRSTFKWSLYTPSINNNLPSLHNYADRINRYVIRWADADPAGRFGIGIIWPGFDDTAVNGWGAGSRALGPKTLDFYETTMDSISRSGLKWVLVATLNDWNEGTIVEPSVLDQFGLGRAEATRRWVEQFKGVDSAYPLSVAEVVKDHYDRIFAGRYR